MFDFAISLAISKSLWIILFPKEVVFEQKGGIVACGLVSDSVSLQFVPISATGICSVTLGKIRRVWPSEELNVRVLVWQSSSEESHWNQWYFISNEPGATRKETLAEPCMPEPLVSDFLVVVLWRGCNISRVTGDEPGGAFGWSYARARGTVSCRRGSSKLSGRSLFFGWIFACVDLKRQNRWTCLLTARRTKWKFPPGMETLRGPAEWDVLPFPPFSCRRETGRYSFPFAATSRISPKPFVFPVASDTLQRCRPCEGIVGQQSIHPETFS